jgi:hypothetical protein
MTEYSLIQGLTSKNPRDPVRPRGGSYFAPREFQNASNPAWL